MEVARYGVYSAWQLGPGEDAGRRFDLMPAGYAGAPNTARLMSFFSMSDIHITDKESPAQVPYYGWNVSFLTSGLYSQAYSPVQRHPEFHLSSSPHSRILPNASIAYLPHRPFARQSDDRPPRQPLPMEITVGCRAGRLSAGQIRTSLFLACTISDPARIICYFPAF